MRLLFICLACVLLGFSSRPKPAPKMGAIHIFYSGLSNKPYPEIYFYLPGCYSDSLWHHGLVTEIPVSPKQYEAIDSFTRKGTDTHDGPYLDDYMNFYFSDGGITWQIKTMDKKAIYAIFRNLHNYFSTTPYSKQLDGSLHSLMYRLGIPDDTYKEGW